MGLLQGLLCARDSGHGIQPPPPPAGPSVSRLLVPKLQDTRDARPQCVIMERRPRVLIEFPGKPLSLIELNYPPLIRTASPRCAAYETHVVLSPSALGRICALWRES